MTRFGLLRSMVVMTAMVGALVGDAGEIVPVLGVDTGAPEASGQAARTVRRRLHGYRSLFTHPPAALDRVSSIAPRGAINGTSHILPVDHMYLRFPFGPTGGADVVQVQAMAPGELVMVTRQTEPGSSLADIAVWIRHTSAITVQVDHLHALAPRIQAHIGSPGDWIIVEPGLEIVFLGQLGAPGPLALAAGEVVGETRSYFEYWDLGVIDTDVVGVFADPHGTRYPALPELAAALGIVIEHAPFTGQQSLNSGCFLSYLAPELRAAWSALLEGPPGNCGRADWDREGYLRGSWFNPAYETIEPTPLLDVESAAISITPYNLAPATTVQIGIASGHPLAAVDPAGAFPQLRRRFLAPIDPAPGARINPDPGTVSPETGIVCYDLRYGDGVDERFNALVLRLTSAHALQIAFDPTPAPASRCAALLGAGTVPWITTYLR